MPDRRTLRLTLAILLLTASAPRAGAEPSQAERVQRDVRTLVEAGYRGDVDTMLGFAHPALVERAGGREATRAAIEQALDRAAREKVALESFSFPREPDFLEGRGRRFAVVPTLSVIRGRGGERLQSRNYLLGVRERGAGRWAYVEGSVLNQHNVRVLFPDFPADYAFPPIERKQL